MGHCPSNPLDKVLRPHKPKPEINDDDEIEIDDENATLPYDLKGDANWQKIRSLLIPYLRNEIVRPGKSRRRCRRGVLTSNPENFLALVELMYFTGLRISDALHFKRSKMRINENGKGIYTTRQIKTRNHVTVMIEPWLVEKLQALPLLDRDRYVFFDGRKSWRRFIANNVGNVLRDFGEAIGMEEVRCHRFRDSFAINQLNMGVPITLLKDLLGHKNLAMTERYYAPFVPGRGDSTVEQADRIRQAYHAGKVVSINLPKAG
jgi:integrase